MLRKVWRWLIGQPVPSRTDALLSQFIESQERTTRAVMQAVSEIGQASQKQADVLQQYLKLFQGSGDPQVWESDPEQSNKDELLEMGFPSEATEAEQAEWVLKHIDRL